MRSLRSAGRFAVLFAFVFLSWAGGTRAQTTDPIIQPHAANGPLPGYPNPCTVCHAMQGPPDVPRRLAYEMCLRCHGAPVSTDDPTGSLGPNIAAEFFLASDQTTVGNSHHPTPERKVGCVNCHYQHGSPGDMPSLLYYWAPIAPGGGLTRWRLTFGDPGGRTRHVQATRDTGKRVCFGCHGTVLNAAGRNPTVVGTAESPETATDNYFSRTRGDHQVHYVGTAHDVSVPAVGPAQIVCLACHAEHGSTIPRLLRTQVGTQSVTGNDNSLCRGCHIPTKGRWLGFDLFAQTRHSISASSTTALAVFPGETGSAGYCRNCHNVHGTPYPNYTRAPGNDICYACHDATGTILPDSYSWRGTTAYEASYHREQACERCHNPHAPAPAAVGCLDCHESTATPQPAPDNEVVVGYGFQTYWQDPVFTAVGVLSQATEGAGPRKSLRRVKLHRLDTLNGPDYGIAVGDATNDGRNDVVQVIHYRRAGQSVAQSGPTPVLVIYEQSADGKRLLPPRPQVLPWAGTMDRPTIADVDADGRNEIVMVGYGAGPYPYTGRGLFRVRMQGSAFVFADRLQIPDSGGSSSSGRVSVANVDADPALEILVTDPAASILSVMDLSVPQYTWDWLKNNYSVATGGQGGLALATGDLDGDGRTEVAVVNQNPANIGVLRQAEVFVTPFLRTTRLTLDQKLIGGLRRFREVAIADLSDDTPGSELLALSPPIGPNSAELTAYNLPAMASPDRLIKALGERVYPTGVAEANIRATVGLAVGDVDGDGKTDAVARGGDAVGVLSHATSIPPAARVYSLPHGQGEGPSLAIGDIGELSPFGHRLDGMASSGCSPCHNVHAASDADPQAGTMGLEASYNGRPNEWSANHLDSGMVLAGSGWRHQLTNVGSSSGGRPRYDGYAYSSKAGDSASLSFDGDGIAWVTGYDGSIAGPGLARVYLDGVYQATVDMGGRAATQRNEPVFERKGLGFGRHVIRVEVTGQYGTGGYYSPNVAVKRFIVYNDYGYQRVGRADKEYRSCLSCHSRRTGKPMTGARSVADEFNPANLSYHAVMGRSKARRDLSPKSFVGTWTADSTLTCGDCHVTRHSGAGAPHPYGLKKPYSGARRTDRNMLCYSCHSYDYYNAVYSMGEALPSQNLLVWALPESSSSRAHGLHKQVACQTCHDPHGSAESFGMVRREMELTPMRYTGGNPPFEVSGDPTTRTGWVMCQAGCHLDGDGRSGTW